MVPICQSVTGNRFSLKQKEKVFKQCVLRYNQSKRIKQGPIKNMKEIIKRNWKGTSTKGFDDLKIKGLVIPSYEKEFKNECG